jgi:hypothetical protein
LESVAAGSVGGFVSIFRSRPDRATYRAAVIVDVGPCLAWIDLFELLWTADRYSELQTEGGDEDQDFVAEHWTAASRRLASCAALVHQGAEFLLKARLIDVSPYLLLDDAGEWPKVAAEVDMDFDEFKTVDARLLVQVHDTVCAERLPASFQQHFERIRVRRNAATHGLSLQLWAMGKRRWQGVLLGTKSSG